MSIKTIAALMQTSGHQIAPVDPIDPIEQGIVFNKTNFDDTSDFLTGAVTVSAVSGRLVLSGGSGTFNNNYLIRLNQNPECDEKVTITIEYELTQAGAGIAIAREAVVYPANSISYSAIADHTLGKAGVGTTFGSAITTTVGHIYRLTLVQYKNRYTATLTNINTSEVSTAYEESSGVTQYISLVPIGGECAISRLTITRNSLKYAQVICVGDSKTKGAGVLDTQRFAALIADSSRVVEVWAGSGDRTGELIYSIPYIISAQPEMVILCMGRNDLQGIPQGTWEANYASAVSQLKSANITVVHLLPIPEPSFDQSLLTAYINTTYPNDTRINVASGWSNGTMLLGDNIHPNTTGHAYISNTIRSAMSW